MAKKSAFGCLSEYAYVSKIPLEKGAWEREVVKNMLLINKNSCRSSRQG